MAGARLRYLALLVAWLGAGSSARADNARALYRRAVEHFSAGELEQSVELLRRARTRASAPELLGKISLYLGVNHEALGDPAAARRAFGQALTHDPSLAVDPARFKASIVEMFEEVRRGLLGTLSVKGSRGTVAIDGGPPLKLPFVGSLPVGAHRVEVRGSDSALLIDRQVVIAVGRTTEIVGPSMPPPPPPASRPTPPQPVPPEVAPVADGPGRPQGPLLDEPVDKPRARVNWPAWLSAGVAVAAGGVGVGLGVASRANEQHALDLGVPHPEAAADHDTAKTQATAANVLFVVAGVAAVAAVVLFYSGAKQGASSAASSSTAAMAIGATGVGVSW